MNDIEGAKHEEELARQKLGVFCRQGAGVMTDLTEKTLATARKYTGKIISVDLLDIESCRGSVNLAEGQQL